MRQMQIWMFLQILTFIFSDPPNEINLDLVVSEYFKIFNFLDPPFDRNADLDVSEDF